MFEIFCGEFDAFISPNYPILGESGVHLKVEYSRLFKRKYFQNPFFTDLHLSDVFSLENFPRNKSRKFARNS